MTSSEHLLRKLTSAVSTGTPTEVETILGQFAPKARAGVARTAAGVAFRSERWDNVAYLADFLHDTTEVRALGGDDDSPGDDEDGPGEVGPGEVGPGDDGLAAAGWDIIRDSDDEAAEPAEPAEPATRTTARGLELASAVGRERPEAKSITASIVDREGPSPQAITFRSRVSGAIRLIADAPHLPLGGDVVGRVADADDSVIGEGVVRVLYSYPLGTAGPTRLEQELGGWVFEERASNGTHFTRADFARAVSARYAEIYAEEARTASKPAGHTSGAPATGGKYRIWGHALSDLDLHAAARDRESGVFVLDVDA